MITNRDKKTGALSFTPTLEDKEKRDLNIRLIELENKYTYLENKYKELEMKIEKIITLGGN